MILFCDTSSLIKLLIKEPGTPEILVASGKALAIPPIGSAGPKPWPP